MERSKRRVANKNRLKNMTEEELKEINETTKRNRGISNLTLKDLFPNWSQEEIEEWAKVNSDE